VYQYNGPYRDTYRFIRTFCRFVSSKASRHATMVGMLETGTKAPDCTLPDQNGETVSLSELAGTTVVLYFSPKADA
jgi:cytochrome oxidase Cu insertion factor (SCO1/SenC/PrrC family)